mgnify:CR=1 FL=1
MSANPWFVVNRFYKSRLLTSNQTHKEAAVKIDEQLNDLAALTYASEIAQTILSFITPSSLATATKVVLAC